MVLEYRRFFRILSRLAVTFKLANPELKLKVTGRWIVHWLVAFTGAKEQLIRSFRVLRWP